MTQGNVDGREQLLSDEEMEELENLANEQTRGLDELPNVFALTAREIRELEAINMDSQTNEMALQVAMTYYRNSVVELQKKKQQFWSAVNGRLQLPHGQDYAVATIDGIVQVVPVKKEQEEQDAPDNDS